MKTLDAVMVLDGSPVPTFVIDAAHKVVHWNRALAQMTGIPASEVIGTHYHWRAFYSAHRPVMADIVLDGGSPDLLEKFYAGRYRRSPLIPGGFEAEGFFPAIGENGRWLSFSAAPLRDAEGALIGCIETLQDISARKESEAARHDSERRLTEIIASSPVPTFVVDHECRVVQWNKACEALTGIFAHEVIGHCDAWRAFYQYDTRHVVLAELVAQGSNADKVASHYGDKVKPSALVPGAYEGRDFFPNFGKQGKYLQFMASPLHDNKGKINGAVETLLELPIPDQYLTA